MKLNGKSISITIGLLFVLWVVGIVEISIFISGPSHKYEDDIAAQIAMVKKDSPAIGDVQRHVFQYVTYVGKADTTYVWYNEEGKLILSREASTYQEAAVLAKAAEKHTLSSPQITLGYGYDNPVYVITTARNETMLYDYDTLEEVYYFKLGDE